VRHGWWRWVGRLDFLEGREDGVVMYMMLVWAVEIDICFCKVDKVSENWPGGGYCSDSVGVPSS
jgi:hypothetical protein